MSDRLNELAALPANWDSYDADPITAIAIKTARDVLAIRPDSDPWCSPTPCGGVDVEWWNPDRELVIDINQDGKIGALKIIGPKGANRRYEESDTIAFDDVAALIDWATA